MSFTEGTVRPQSHRYGDQMPAPWKPPWLLGNNRGIPNWLVSGCWRLQTGHSAKNLFVIALVNHRFQWYSAGKMPTSPSIHRVVVET